jgi:hypothetical protein
VVVGEVAPVVVAGVLAFPSLVVFLVSGFPAPALTGDPGVAGPGFLAAVVPGVAGFAVVVFVPGFFAVVVGVAPGFATPGLPGVLAPGVGLTPGFTPGFTPGLVPGAGFFATGFFGGTA